MFLCLKFRWLELWMSVRVHLYCVVLRGWRYIDGLSHCQGSPNKTFKMIHSFWN